MISEQATYLAYAGGWRAVRLMPEPLAYAMFDRIADQQWRSRSKGVRRLEANLARVLGPVGQERLREVSRAGMRSYMRYWCDAFRMPGWGADRIDSFRLRNQERLTEPVHERRGVVLALPHMGNWDHAGAWVSRNLSPINTVAERLEPARLFDAFVAFREGLGMRIHGLGDPGVFAALADALRAGGVVALLADRDLSASGVDVQFLGQAARFPAGPAALAIDTGADLVPVSLFPIGDSNGAELLDPITPSADGSRVERVRATTQAIADALGEAIRAHPEHWHMLQRLWLADLDPARLAARDAQRPAPGADVDAGRPPGSR